MFKRLRSAFGADGPSVNTVLDTPVAHPGGTVSGWIHIQGEAVINRLELGVVLQAELEVRHERRRYPWATALNRLVVGRDLRVPANQRLDIPFSLSLPWETPPSAIGDAVLPILVGVRTELVVDNAHDSSDLDPVLVQPLPSQHRVLDAFGELGTTFTNVDVFLDPIPDVPQEHDFCLKLQFDPPPWAAGALNQVELGFIAHPRDLWVLLAVNKRAHPLRFGHEVSGKFHTTHDAAVLTNWTSLIGQWLTHACQD